MVQVPGQSHPIQTTAHEDCISLVGPKWYALHTRPRHEKKVAEQIRDKSLESFLPLHRCRHRWKNGVTADVELPLFPGYVFARATLFDRLPLVQLPGVLGIAISSVNPTSIPEADIAMLRSAVDCMRAEPHPYLAAGGQVRIVAGPLAGMTGVLTRWKGECRVVLSIDIVMQAISVEVSEFDVVPVSMRSQLA